MREKLKYDEILLTSDLKDDALRRRLTEAWLNAETTLAEERALAGYFEVYGAAAEEEAIAELLSVSRLPELYAEDALKEGGTEEAKETSGTIIEAAVTAPHRPYLKWLAAIAACAAALLIGIILWKPQEVQVGMSMDEIAQGLLALERMDIGGIEHLEARPAGEAMVITAMLRDGGQSSYVLTQGADDGSLLLLPVGE